MRKGFVVGSRRRERFLNSGDRINDFRRMLENLRGKFGTLSKHDVQGMIMTNVNAEAIDISRVVCIARKAGMEILRVYHSTDAAKFETKGDDSPLTEADRAAHRVISQRLERFFPDIPVLSEEGKEIPLERREMWDRFWLVDPLDGTKEFLKRNGEFTVNIALIENGKAVAGVVHAPELSTTYFADHRGGFKLDRYGHISRITGAKKHNGFRVVASRSHMTPETEKFVSELEATHGEVELITIGSSLKLCLVAEGEADIYPRLAPTMEWDTAAAQAVVEKCGGKVIDHETGKPLEYNKSSLLNPFFVVERGEVKSASGELPEVVCDPE